MRRGPLLASKAARARALCTYSERMAKTGRPISPALSIPYRFPLIAISSITVRITGVLLTAGAPRDAEACGSSHAAERAPPLERTLSRRRNRWRRTRRAGTRAECGVRGRADHRRLVVRVGRQVFRGVPPHLPLPWRCPPRRAPARPSPIVHGALSFPAKPARRVRRFGTSRREASPIRTCSIRATRSSVARACPRRRVRTRTTPIPPARPRPPIGAAAAPRRGVWPHQPRARLVLDRLARGQEEEGVSAARRTPRRNTRRVVHRARERHPALPHSVGGRQRSVHRGAPRASSSCQLPAPCCDLRAVRIQNRAAVSLWRARPHTTYRRALAPRLAGTRVGLAHDAGRGGLIRVSDAMGHGAWGAREPDTCTVAPNLDNCQTTESSQSGRAN